MERTELFVCRCHWKEHQMILYTIDNEKEVFGSFHLKNFGMWTRVKSAFGYILGFERRYGDFDQMLFKLEDTDRLKDVVSILSLDSNAVKCGTFEPRVYEQKNTGKMWRVTEHFSWQFESEDILYTWKTETQECLTDPSSGKYFDITITPSLIHRPFWSRLYAGIRHIFGFRSCYGGFDSFEWTETDASQLTALIQSIKENSFDQDNNSLS